MLLGIHFFRFSKGKKLSPVFKVQFQAKHRGHHRHISRRCGKTINYIETQKINLNKTTPHTSQLLKDLR